MESSKEFEECVICLEDLKENIVILNCKHIYHYSCIQQWFFKKKRLSCPMCRGESEIVNILNETHKININININMDMPKIKLRRTNTSNIFRNSNCCIIL